jgi:hypothetical protein
MKDFVGVVPGVNCFLELDSLKEMALIFDRVCLPHASAMLSKVRRTYGARYDERAAEIAWLIENGVVFEATFDDLRGDPDHDRELSDHDLNSLHDLVEIRWGYQIESNDLREKMNTSRARRDLAHYLELMRRVSEEGADSEKVAEMKTIEARSPHFNLIKKSIVAMFEDTFYETRWVAARLRGLHGFDAVPVADIGDNLEDNDFTDKRSDIVRISLNELLMPEESVPWEQIIEYRQDPETKSSFQDLRFWMSEMTRSEMKASEIEERLEFLIHRYNKHMALHKMKAHRGTVEAILMTGAELLESLLRLKFSNIAHGLFAIKHQRVALLEAELSAPGNEIAYIAKTQDRFSK